MIRSTDGRRRRVLVAVAVLFAVLAVGVVLLHLGEHSPPERAEAPRIESPSRPPGTPVVPPTTRPGVSFPPWTNRPFGPPELRVLVRDEFDRPIAGAHAYARWPATPSSNVLYIGGKPTGETNGVTGPFGRMEVWGVPDGPVIVWATSDGYVTSDRIIASALRGATAEIRIELARGLTLEGKVVTDDGLPVQKATVRAHELTGDATPRVGQVLIQAGTEADEEGRFRLEALRPGQYELVARAADRLGGAGVILPSGPVTLRLRSSERPVAILRGRVSLRGDVRPPACQVSCEPQDPPAAKVSTATQDGGFQLSVEPGELELTARCDGLWPFAQVSTRLHVEAGSSTSVDLVVESGLEWSGRVLDRGGAPVPEASVQASLLGAEDPERVPHGAALSLSDAGGKFVLHGLASTSYRVEAWLGPRNVETISSPASGPLVLVLPPEPEVTGRVVGPDGAPVRSYLVNGRQVGDSQGRFSMLFFRRERILRIVAIGVGSAVVQLPSEAGPVDLGTIVLAAERGVAGRVLDARTRAPVAGALIEPGVEPVSAMVGFEHYNGGGDVSGSTRTDAEGRFLYAHASRTPVLVSHPAYMRVEQLLSAGENTILLESAAVLEGRVLGVRDPTCVSATGETYDAVQSTTSAGGSFRLPGLDRGLWTVRAGCAEEGEAGRVQVDGSGTYSVVVPAPRVP